MKRTPRRALLAAACAVALGTAPALATHSWNNYHWVRSGTEIAPPIRTAITESLWGTYVRTAVADWNKSGVVESPGPTAAAVSAKRCKPIYGEILVCNERYGRTGWLGVAQIWLSDGHIVQGITKLNDTYFNTSTYDTPAWRALVTCQELGHDYGLGHQDEDFDTDLTNSCMDYTSVPEGNEHPDQHDYDQLASIYNHTEAATASSTTAASRALAAQAEGGDTPAEWGRPIDFTADGRPHVYMQQVAPGLRKITHVFWAIGEGPRGRR